MMQLFWVNKLFSSKSQLYDAIFLGGLGWQGVIEEREGSKAGIAALARSCKSHAT
jgi:hypothetical protein